MNERKRKFRSISDREAQIIWTMCKQSPSGRWSGITQVIGEIERVRGGKTMTRQTVYDFLKAYPRPDAGYDNIGKKTSIKRKSPEEIIESARIQMDTEDKGGWNRRHASGVLYSVLYRLWKDHTLLLDAGGSYYSKEKRANYWISWANPLLFSEGYGWEGPTVFPDSERASERSIKLTKVFQNRELLMVSFEVTWDEFDNAKTM